MVVMMVMTEAMVVMVVMAAVMVVMAVVKSMPWRWSDVAGEITDA